MSRHLPVTWLLIVAAGCGSKGSGPSDVQVDDAAAEGTDVWPDDGIDVGPDDGPDADDDGSPPADVYAIPASRVIPWDPGARTDWTVTRTAICATLSPSGGDDGDDIEAALDACPEGGVVMLAAGTFRIDASIEWPKSGVSLRGSGRTSTLLVGSPGFSGSAFFDFYNGHGVEPDWDWSASPSHALVAGLAKGSSEVSTADPHGWAAGDYVLIDQDNDEEGDPPWTDSGYGDECDWCSRLDGERLMGQVVRVASVVDEDTVTVDPPLYADFEAGQDASGVRHTGFLQGISVESLQVDNTASGATDTFYAYGLYDSIFHDLDVTGVGAGSHSMHFHLFNGLWNTIRHSTIRNALDDSTNNGYGIFLGYATSAFLVEDNVFDGLTLGVAFEGSASGHVAAYNYTVNSRWYDATVNRLMIIGHGGGSFMNLIEGNVIEGRFRSDNYFGTQHGWTVFRNRIEQMTGVTSQLCTFDLEEGSHYVNAVGNVLGREGWETVYECEADPCADSVSTIYRLGYEGAYDEDAAGNDAAVRSTMLRHRNFDYQSDGVKSCSEADEPGCHGSDGGVTALPDSLYLSGAPAWFGTCTWPPFDPVGPVISDIPAERRHEGSPCAP